MAISRKPPLARQIAADPELARIDRIAIALTMSADQFSIDDIARVSSIRRQIIVGLRQQTFLPPRPDNKRSVHSNRPLEPVVEALARTGIQDLPGRCRELGIHQVSGWGILRAIEYSTRDKSDDRPRALRCPGCEQITPCHPCQFCGSTWLREEWAG